MKIPLFYFILYLNLLTGQSLLGQDKAVVDSLQTVLQGTDDDTLKCNILYAISKSYWGSNPEKSQYYANQTLKLSKKVGFKKGIGNAFNSLAAIQMFKGNYMPAMQLFQKSLKIRLEINDKQGIAWSYNNIGNIFYEQGNFPEALKQYLASLKIRDEIDDKNGIAASYNNIGNIYMLLGNHLEALKNYQASLEIRKIIGFKKGIAECYGNIGNIYLRLNNYSEALKSQNEALKIFTEIIHKGGIAITYSLIGDINFKQTKFSEALQNYLDALSIYQQIEDKDHIAGSYNSIGNAYIKLNNYNEARDYLIKALSISKTIGSLENIKHSYENLSLLDSTTGNFKEALKNHKFYILYRDSLENKENTKKIVQQQMQFDFDKRESLNKATQDKKDTLARQTRNVLTLGFLATLIFAIVFLVQKKKISKQKLKSDELLQNILPVEVAEELKQSGHSAAKTFQNVTVMFTDFKDFTSVSEKVSPELLVLELHTCFSAFDKIIQKYKIEKIKTIGDAYMCVSGLPIRNEIHAHNMVNAAIDILEFMNSRKQEKRLNGGFTFDIRIGINTGSVIAGIVGIKKFSYDIWGDTVNKASRMESSSESGKINISGSTYELIKNEFKCEYRGKIQAKNKGEMDMYFLEHRI